MNCFKQMRSRLGWSLMALTVFSACSRPYQASKADYKEYGISKEIADDSSIVRYYLPYKQKMQAEMNTVIGKSDIAMTGGRKNETLLGDFFSDAIFAQGRKLDPSIQFTFATSGGLRNGLPAGDITVNDVFELMPFENELMVLKLKGDDVVKLLDYIAKSGGQPVAGLRMTIKDGKASEVQIGGQPFDPALTYTLLTYDYLVNSGGELTFLGNALEKKILGKKLRDSILDEIKEKTEEGKMITAKLDGRISIED